MSALNARRAFAKIRNAGILARNKAQVMAGDDGTDFERIKSVSSADSDKSEAVVHCNVCSGSYSNKYFYRHKLICKKSESNRPAQPVFTTLLGIKETDDFLDVLSRFQTNEIGHTCRTDQTIKLIGRHLWQKDKTKVDKHDEVRKSVMSDMRNLANLYLNFKSCVKNDSKFQDAADMFDRKHWSALQEAIVNVTTNDLDTPEKPIKYGLKNTMYYLLIKAADVLLGNELAQKGQEMKVQEIKNFLILLKHNQNSLFGDSKYLINKARQEKLRLPERTPPEETMSVLRNYTLDRIKELVAANEIGKTEYVEMRNLVCCRMTLFNARRGGEASRLKVSQWMNRSKWLDSDQVKQLSDEEQQWFKELTILYGTGKGNHLVSCIIPNDLVAAIEILISPDIRKRAGVLDENDFLFPSTGSTLHCGGWDATKYVCIQAGIQTDLINATNQRGRLSTLYAAQDIPENQREFFYSHMGHSAQVNAGTYQRPLAVQAVTRVGSYLLTVDSQLAGERVTPLLSAGAPDPGPSSSYAHATTKGPVTNHDSRMLSDGSVETVLCILGSQTLIEDSPQCSTSEDTGIKITSDEDSCPVVNSIKRARWTTTQTKLIQTEFKKWVQLPSPIKKLPGKKLMESLYGDQGLALQLLTS